MAISGAHRPRGAAGGTGADDRGGNGGAGTIFLKAAAQAHGDLIVDNGGVTAAPGSTPLRAIGRGTSAALAPTTLTNTAAAFPLPNPATGAIGLIGLQLNPNTAQGQTFTVLDNTATTLTTDSADGDLTAAASVGSPYVGVYTFDTLTVRGGAALTTADNCVVLGVLTISAASVSCNNLTQSASWQGEGLPVMVSEVTSPDQDPEGLTPTHTLPRQGGGE